MPTPDTRTIVHEMLAAVASVNCNAEADDHTTACDKMTEILLAKWEECERFEKLLSFDGCEADEVVASMPNKFPDALIVRRSWFEGERREELKNTENRYIEAMDQVQRLTSRLAAAEAVVSAVQRGIKTREISPIPSRLHSALSTYEGKSE